METVFTNIINGFNRVIQIMKTTIFTFGGFSVSLFDVLLAALLIDLFLMVFLPFYNGEDDD